MTEKQKTKTVEFKTRNSKVKFKVRKGIARMGAGLKYPNAKEVVPKEEHVKVLDLRKNNFSLRDSFFEELRR